MRVPEGGSKETCEAAGLERATTRRLGLCAGAVRRNVT